MRFTPLEAHLGSGSFDCAVPEALRMSSYSRQSPRTSDASQSLLTRPRWPPSALHERRGRNRYGPLLSPVLPEVGTAPRALHRQLLQNYLPDAIVPLNWIAVGDPVEILPPSEHERIWAIQRDLDFPKYVFGIEGRPPIGEVMSEVMPRYARALQAHRADRLL